MPTVPIKCRVRALYSFKSNDRSSLQFNQGDVIQVLTKLKSGWWDGWLNGSRGWFPSNYVEVIEEYTNAMMVELPTANHDTTKQQHQQQQQQQPDLGQQQSSYGDSNRPYTSNTSPPLPRVPRDGVPLQRNQAYRLSLPYNDTIEVNLHQQQQQQQRKPDLSLPSNWIMEMTEDGSDCYYYNKLTGEMRTTPPTHDERFNTIQQQLDNDSGDSRHGHSDDDDDDDDSVFSAHDNNDFDFQSVVGNLDAVKMNAAGCGYDSNDEDLFHGKDDDDDTSERLPSHWVKRTNHQGRTYYCNLQTQDTTWHVKSIDPITGNLLSPSKSIDQLSFTSTLNSNGADTRGTKDSSHHLTNSKSSSSSSSSSFTSPPIQRLDPNQPLTWNTLSSLIAIAINRLTLAGKNQEKALFVECADGVIDSIRLMLLASGTIDKDSGVIRSNTILRGHHRTMMAAMSKVMLTSFLTADSGSGSDTMTVTRLLNENSDLLVAVRNFVGACQDLGVPVNHIDPKLISNDQHNDKYHHQQQQQPQKQQQTKYALQHDLADNLDAYGTNMLESVDAILATIKNGRQQLKNSNSSNDHDLLDSSRSQFGTNMFTQFRNLSSQTGQFLGLVDDIDFGLVKEGSPLMLNLSQNKQALSDGLGRLFCHLQQLTNQHVPLAGVLVDAQHAAESIHIPIRNICECINIMVYDLEMSTARSSLVDAITTNDTKQPALEPFDGIGDPQHQHPTTTTTNSTIKHSNNNSDDDDDQTTVMNDSIFSGGNFTFNESEVTAPSTVAAEYLNHSSVSPENQSPFSKDPQIATKRKASIAHTTAAVVEKSPQRQEATTNSTASPPNKPAPTATPDPDVAKTSHKLKKFFGDDVPSSSDIATTKPTSAERPSYLLYDYDLTDISFNMEGNIKGGTLPALVERLTLHDYLDMNFNNTFLLTYRSFCTSTELLDLLEARYNLTPPHDISDEELECWRQKKLKLVRLRVFNVLKNWLEVYYNEEDHIILDRLMVFTDTTIRNTLSFSTDQLERLIQKRKEGTEMDVGGLKKLVWTPQSIPQSILPRNPKKFKLLDIEPIELARQLTIMDFKMYSSIRPIECLDKSWSRDTPSCEGAGGEDTAVVPTAVNIRASIEYCNQITSWVSDAILSQNDIKKRSNLIKFWVQVAEKCRELNNFNTCMAILSAFDNSSVGRLKRTWEMVGARTNQILSHIRRIMGANRNFSEYRQLIHSVNPPCIPFLGIYLQDLTFIEDGNSNVIKKHQKDLINFAKREKTAEVIREIQQYQTLFYKLKTVDEMQMFIRANLQSTRDEDQLYKESLKLEPREREDEKITRLLQESGFL